MKTFKDLKFKQHSIAKSGLPLFNDAKQATLTFENGYGVSVIFGKCFYSNGINTYEVAITYNGEITYNSGITNDVMRYLEENEVSDVMIKVQKLN